MLRAESAQAAGKERGCCGQRARKSRAKKEEGAYGRRIYRLF